VKSSSHLAGTLAHLSALSAKSSHSLFAPFGTHPTLNVHHHRKSIFILDFMVTKETTGESSSSVNQTEKGRGDELGVLNHCLEVLHGRIRFDLIGSGNAARALNEDLHFFSSPQLELASLYKRTI
jgi:hypothetical protein